MPKTSAKRHHRAGSRSRMRRPLAAVAIGSLGLIGVGEPATAAAPKHFEGTFSGQGTFTPNDQRCSFLGGFYASDAYRYTFDFPEEDWISRSTACATISGDPPRYVAAGNVTITRPGGTLTGSYATSNLLPVPRNHQGVTHITGGTGLFEDASGKCVLTDWVVNGTTLSGSVTCDVSPK